MMDTHAIKLPESWALTRVGEVCTNIKYGYTASASEERTGPRFLRITDIQNGQVRWETVPYCTIEPEQIAKYALNVGDIVFARTGGTVGKSFLITTVPEESVFASYLIRLSAHAGILPKFLYYFFQSAAYWEQIGLKKGGLQGNVNATTLASLEFPVCPFREQARIVGKIEELFSELDNGIESLKIAREQTEIYRQSVLKQAFEGKLTARWRTEANTGDKQPAPTTVHSPSLAQSTAEIHTLPSLPSLWNWSKLGDVADITGGLTKNPARNHFPRRVKYLRVANVYADSLNLAEIHEIGVTDAELDRVLLQQGDLLIVEGNGSIDQIGRVAAWGGEIPECAHQNHIIKARPHANVRTRYLLHFLLSKVGRDLIIRVASSTSGLHTLSVTKVSNLKIPLTSVEEQEQVLLAIDKKLSVAEKFIEEIDKAIVACEVLRRSILKRAFSGELIAQDPKDEPACALLERIKTERTDKEKDRSKSKKRNDRRKAA